MARFQPGHSGGRPRGAKNKLHRSFIEALAKDFEEHGEDAIRICRVEEPTRYLQVIASILPKEFLFENVMGDMEDEQLDDLIAALRQRVLENRQAVALPAPERTTNGHDCA
jgi:hypothetical protein